MMFSEWIETNPPHNVDVMAWRLIDQTWSLSVVSYNDNGWSDGKISEDHRWAYKPSFEKSATIEIDLTEDELLTLFKHAHDRNMTFNHFISTII
ncbi:MAG: hypothetical protein WC284_16520, partial [Candidimonas sp.]